MARPAYSDKKHSDKILSRLPADGSRLPLTELRAYLREDHMSPSTLNTELRTLEKFRSVKRIIDTETRPPRVYYKRTPEIPRGHVQYDKWLQLHLDFIKGVLDIALSEIVNNPQIALDRPKHHMDLAISSRCWTIVSDFRELMQSKRISGIEHLGGYDVFDESDAAWSDRLFEPFELELSFERIEKHDRHQK